MKHTLSYIHPNAQIGKNVTISPFSVINEDVVIGDGCWIGSHVNIMSGTRIGENCRVFPGAILGAIPQDLKFEGETTTLEIGNEVTIREHCTLNRGTKAHGKTTIDDNTLLMCYVHIAHDCIIGKNCVLSGYTGLAGHVEIGDFAILGGYTAVHQFVKIGEYAFTRGGTLVGKDVPPYAIAARDPVYFANVNVTGLRRKHFSNAEIAHIQHIYKTLYAKGRNISQALKYIEANIDSSPHRKKILDFIRNSQRGIIKRPNHVNGHTVE